MTIQTGIGLSTAKDPAQATKEATREAKIHITNGKINLAFIFSSIEYNHPAVFETITSLLGEETPVLGCSGLATISNQGTFKRSLVVMLVNLPAGIYFTASNIKKTEAASTLEAGEKLGEKLLYGFKDIRKDLGMIFAKGLIPDSSRLISGLQQRLGISFPLVGGSASDNLSFQGAYPYFNEETSENVACGIVWGGKINFGLGIKHGWKPLGKPRRVTRSKDNIVSEIDNAPAIKIYGEYFAKDILELKKDLKHISVLYPIGIYLPGEEEYLLRNILSIQEDGSLVFQGNVPEESTIRLMIGTKESCLLATRQAAEEVKESLKDRQISCTFIFDSVSRQILLGRQANREIEIIREVLGQDVPLVGVYTYGEYAPLKAINYLGKTYFHNQTINILGIAG